jgi:aminomethyltransferase
MTHDPVSERHTALFAEHVALGARMAPFGGFRMPIQYRGIMDEHQACRQRVAVFDTCHMGEFRLAGPSALSDLERLVTCPVATLAVGQCRYGLLCNAAGGVLDDLLVYRLAEDAFMLVVNAGTCAQDAAWIRAHLSAGTCFTDESETLAKLDIQGPLAPRLVTAILGCDLKSLRFYRFLTCDWDGAPTLVSRTGYTGEIGFELYVPVERAVRLWRACLAGGAAPAGLGARDTLRLEMGMPLYGHELDATRNAGTSGFARAIASTKPFIGQESLTPIADAPERLVGLRLTGRRAARAGAGVRREGRPVGVVTSGSFGPSLGHAVALGYVAREAAAIGTAVTIEGGRDWLPATVAQLPFYDAATARQPIANFLFDPAV